MQKYLVLTILLSLSFLTAFAANLQVVPTTTLAAESGNNTSAPDAINSTTRGYAASGNISKLPIKSLLYPGATPKVYAALMGWFGKSGHISVGYNSQDAAQVKKQVEDMQSRSIDGAILAWYGQGSYEDYTALQLKTQAEAHPGFSFILMVDQGTIQWNSQGMTPTDALIYHLNYMAQTYYSSPAYARINGRPVVLEFDLEAWPIDWARVMSSIQGNPVIIFRNPPAFTNTYAYGGYSWGPVSGLAYTDFFNQTAEQHPGKLVMADGWKGFNDVLASWSQHRVVDQQCGQTWLNSMAELSKYFSNTNQLPFLQLPTWNDYEEGTTIESGIDNCISLTANTSGGVLQWQLSGAGMENTIDHYTAYVSTDGENLMPLAEVPTGTYSLDLSRFNLAAGGYTVYVKAVGKASLKNQMSNAATFTVAVPPVSAVNITLLSTQPNAATPLHLMASAVSSLPVTGMWVYLDNVGIYGTSAGSLNINITVRAGTHVLQVKAWDNTGHITSSSVTLNVAAGTLAPRSSRSAENGVPIVAARLSGSSMVTVNSVNADVPRATRLRR